MVRSTRRWWAPASPIVRVGGSPAEQNALTHNRVPERLVLRCRRVVLNSEPRPVGEPAERCEGRVPVMAVQQIRRRHLAIQPIGGRHAGSSQRSGNIAAQYG